MTIDTAYARGMISSRDIAFAYEQNVTFMALSARGIQGAHPLERKFLVPEDFKFN